MFSITHVKLFQKNLFELRRPSFFFHFLHSAREILSVFASKTFLFTRRRKKRRKNLFFSFSQILLFSETYVRSGRWLVVPASGSSSSAPAQRGLFFFFQVKSRMKIRASSPKCSFFFGGAGPITNCSYSSNF